MEWILWGLIGLLLVVVCQFLGGQAHIGNQVNKTPKPWPLPAAGEGLGITDHMAESCRYDLRKFIHLYLPEYCGRLEDEHLRAIVSIQNAVLHGESIDSHLQQFEGLVLGTAIWAEIYGHRKFALIITPNEAVRDYLERKFRDYFFELHPAHQAFQPGEMMRTVTLLADDESKAIRLGPSDEIQRPDLLVFVGCESAGKDPEISRRRIDRVIGYYWQCHCAPLPLASIAFETRPSGESSATMGLEGFIPWLP